LFFHVCFLQIYNSIVIIMTIVKYLTIYYTFGVITYRPFWETLKKSNESTYTLINKHHVSSATIERLRKGLGVSTVTLDDLCEILSCNVSDIIEYRFYNKYWGGDKKESIKFFS